MRDSTESIEKGGAVGQQYGDGLGSTSPTSAMRASTGARSCKPSRMPLDVHRREEGGSSASSPAAPLTSPDIAMRAEFLAAVNAAEADSGLSIEAEELEANVPPQVVSMSQDTSVAAEVEANENREETHVTLSPCVDAPNLGPESRKSEAAALERSSLQHSASEATQPSSYPNRQDAELPLDPAQHTAHSFSGNSLIDKFQHARRTPDSGLTWDAGGDRHQLSDEGRRQSVSFAAIPEEEAATGPQRGVAPEPQQGKERSLKSDPRENAPLLRCATPPVKTKQQQGGGGGDVGSHQREGRGRTAASPWSSPSRSPGTAWDGTTAVSRVQNPYSTLTFPGGTNKGGHVASSGSSPLAQPSSRGQRPGHPSFDVDDPAQVRLVGVGFPDMKSPVSLSHLLLRSLRSL